jgi:hypothetical protein
MSADPRVLEPDDFRERLVVEMEDIPFQGSANGEEAAQPAESVGSAFAEESREVHATDMLPHATEMGRRCHPYVRWRSWLILASIYGRKYLVCPVGDRHLYHVRLQTRLPALDG